MSAGRWIRGLLFLAVAGAFAVPRQAGAALSLGTGNAGLLGGDLTDPEDKVVPTDKNMGLDLPEADLRPPNATWLRMTCAPANGPGSPPHQRHPYQSWQGSPACAIFLNRPQTLKWYVGFKDGGYGGPTRTDPYFCAVELKDACVLTHFTVTLGPDMPERDPREWAIQGSNTGDEEDWTDLYVCNAKDRNGTPFKAGSRSETFLYTSFTSADMARAVRPADAKKIEARLAGKKIETADFKRPAQAFPWFRIVIYSCFNPNSMQVADFNHPPGFALGQVEFFGVPGPRAPATAHSKPKPAVDLIPPAAYDPAFIISYWCGPPRAQTTLERYREIKDCGFTVAYPAIDQLWEPASAQADEHLRRYLDVCQKVGLKALVWDGAMPKGEGGWTPPAPAEVPQIEKALDGLIAKYSSHPAFLGYVLGDEMGIPQHPRLALVTQYLLKKDPKHLPYYNLLPNYAFKQNSEYEAMVQDYLDTVKPALVSWDHYRQMFEGGDEGFYWHNLEIIRRLCVKARIPYNQIIVSIKHMGYRECSEADLRWQVWTSLAFGSRGIQYFTYCHVPGMAWGDAPALLTKDFKRDAKYEYVKKINRRIAKLGPTLVKLTCTGAYGTEPLMPGMRKLPASAPVAKAEGGPLLIGCFRDAGGKTFILPVNRSFKEGITARLTPAAGFISAVEVSQETGAALPAVPLAQRALEVPLEPGEGRLFALIGP